MLTREQRQTFDETGFLRVANVFSAAEIEAFRRVSATLPPGGHQTKYLYQLPELQDLWADPRLIDIAQQLLPAPLTYFFESSVHRYDFRLGNESDARHLHHDAKGAPENIYNRVNAALPGTYPALRFAIYLQDTQAQSGGLKVGVGTHKIDVSSFENRDLRLFNIHSAPGDVVIFTHRLLHSPLALRLKDTPGKALTPEEEDALFEAAPEWFLPIPEIRESIFIDYASLDESADLYIKNRALHSTDRASQLAAILVDEGFLDKHADSALTFRVDKAIVETIDGISRSIVNGGVGQDGVIHLWRLPRLCQAYFETSAHHSLYRTESEVEDFTAETGLRLYNEIAPRLAGLRRQAPARRSDPHMGYTPTVLRRMRNRKDA